MNIIFKKFLVKRKLKWMPLFITLSTLLNTLTFGQGELLTVLEGADSVKSPTSVLAVGDVAKITLSWTNAGIYDSIKIYRDISTDPTTLVYTLAGSLTSKIDTSLTGGTIYYYRIKGEIGNNLSPYSSNASDTVLFSTQAQQYFSRLPTAISMDTLAFYAAFIDSMNGRGYWARVDEMWMLANKTLANALIGMKGKKDATANETYTFTPYQGWAGNDVNGYINTNFIPTADASNYLLDRAGFGFYSRSTGAYAGKDMGVTNGTYYSMLTAQTTGNQVDLWINADVGNTSRANTSSGGFIYGTRWNSSLYATYKNGVIIVAQNARTSTSIPDKAFFFGALNNNGTANNFVGREFAIVLIGDYFTPTELVLITGFMETLLDNLGVGVIP